MSVTVRPAKLEDLPALLAIEQAATTAAHWPAEQYSTRLAEGHILLAENEVSVCGFICARVAAGEWEIENIVVAAGQRRRGAGEELLRALIATSRDAGGVAVLLEVRDSNVPARRLYEKHGFRVSGRRRQYYREPSEDAVLYKLVVVP